VLYDAVADPDSGVVYMIPWKARPRLARYWPEDGPDGRLEDLGPLTEPFPTDRPVGVNTDHVGGLVFSGDGRLYYVKSVWDLEVVETGRVDPRDATRSIAMLARYDPATGAHEDLASLCGGTGRHHYISRGAADADGDLYFGKVLARPAGVYRVTGLGRGAAPLRLWG